MATSREEFEYIARFRAEALGAAKQAADMLREWADATDEVSGSAEDMQRRVDGAVGKTVAAFAAMAAGVRVAYETISQSLSAYGEFDRTLIGIAKTSNLTDAEVQKLGDSFGALAVQKGIDSRQFLEVAQIAGQLGVKGADGIRDFTQTVVDLGNASNLAGEEGAQVLARMLTVSGEGIEEADRLASVIVKMGNNVAASEREIALAAQEIMLATAPFDVGTTRATALAAAMAEMGLRAELSGTSVGRIFVEMTTAAANGGEALTLFAKATGTTEAEFKRLQASDPTQLFMRLLQVMSSKDQKEIITTLTDLKVMNSESAKSLLPLIANYERLAEVMDMGIAEGNAPSALAEEVARAEQSFDRMYIRVREMMKGLMVELGEALAPVARSIMQTILDIGSAFGSLPEGIRKAVLVITALVPVIGTVATGILAVRSALTMLGVSFGIVSTATAAFNAAMVVMRGVMLTLAINVGTLGTAAGIAATAVTALGAAIRVMTGPVGLAVTALGAMVAAYQLFKDEGSRTADELAKAFDESASKTEELNASLRSGVAQMLTVKQAYQDAIRKGDADAQLSAQRAIDNIQAQIDKTTELMALEANRRRAALAEARENLSREQRELLAQMETTALRAMPGYTRNPENEKRNPRPEVDAAFEDWRNYYTTILNEAMELGVKVDFSDLDDATAEFEEARTQVNVFQAQLDALSAGKAASEVNTLGTTVETVAETAGRDLAKLVSEYAGSEGKIKELTAERARVQQAAIEAGVTGNHALARTYLEVIEGINREIEGLTPLGGIMAEHMAQTQQLQDLAKQRQIVEAELTQAMKDGDTEKVDSLTRVINAIDQQVKDVRESFNKIGVDVDAFQTKMRGYAKGIGTAVGEWFKNTLNIDFNTIESEMTAAQSGLLELIKKGESGGDYNATLDNGRWTNGPQDLVNMTLREVRALQDRMRTPENRAKYGNGKGSSALGAYQIVGTTLQSLMDDLGLTGDELYNKEMQDRLATELIRRRRGQGVEGLRQEWTSLNNYNPSVIQTAMGNTEVPRQDEELAREAKRKADEAKRDAEQRLDMQQKFGREKANEIALEQFRQSVEGMSVTAREKAIRLYEYELELKDRGLTLDTKIAGTGMTYRQQFEQAEASAIRVLELVPSIRDAMDLQIQSLADAQATADQVVGDFVGAFDNAIDGFLETGKLSSITDAFGSAFQQMGAELIKFAVQAMIVKPILDSLKQSLEDFGSGGGGGGFFGFLGKAVGALFGGGRGTSTTQNAKGAVFDKSQTVAMAHMGEAGPEGLLPLARGPGGELMVKAIGAPGAQDDGELASVMRLALSTAQAFAQAQQATVQQAAYAEVPTRASSTASGGAAALPAITYAPTFNIDARGNVEAGAQQGMSEKDAAGFGAALDAHIRNAITSFLIDQQRSGGLLNPASKPYGV